MENYGEPLDEAKARLEAELDTINRQITREKAEKNLESIWRRLSYDELVAFLKSLSYNDALELQTLCMKKEEICLEEFENCDAIEDKDGLDKWVKDKESIKRRMRRCYVRMMRYNMYGRIISRLCMKELDYYYE